MGHFLFFFFFHILLRFTATYNDCTDALISLGWYHFIRSIPAHCFVSLVNLGGWGITVLGVTVRYLRLYPSLLAL